MRSLLPAHFGEIAVPVGGGHHSIHQEIAARDKSTIRPHEQRTDGAHFVLGRCTSRHRSVDHAPVTGATGAQGLRRHTRGELRHLGFAFWGANVGFATCRPALRTL
jgi:hypothetical protein